jgi:hypothetical protein
VHEAVTAIKIRMLPVSRHLMQEAQASFDRYATCLPEELTAPVLHHVFEL